ncbi:MAG: hypothetical protein ACRDQZ_03510 [Mycobacteriales bacterium]
MTTILGTVGATIIAEQAVNNLSGKWFRDIGDALPEDKREHARKVGDQTRDMWNNWESFRRGGIFSKTGNAVQIYINSVRARTAAHKVR